jgi:hypothetical protein
VHCVRTDPGHKNLELKRCQHPGRTCQKLVHHISTINWGQSEGVPDDIGCTCREHTPAYTLQDQDKLTFSQKHPKVVPTIPTTTRTKTKMKRQLCKKIQMTNHPIRRNIPSLLQNLGDGHFQVAQQENIKIQTLLQVPEVYQPFLEKSTHVLPRQSFIPYLQAFNNTLLSQKMYFGKHEMPLRIPQLQKFPLNLATITSFNAIWRYYHELNLSKPRMKSDIMMTILARIPYHLNQHMHTTSKVTTTCDIFLLHQRSWQEKQ